LDEANEFKDHAIANVAVQGHVRLDHSEGKRCCMRRTLPGAHLHVGLVAVPQLEADGSPKTNAAGEALFKHRLDRFSSMMVSNAQYHPLFAFNPDGTLVDDDKRKFMSAAWVLGVVTDSNQSKDMLSIHVDVRPIRYAHRPADLADSPHAALDGRTTLTANKRLFARPVLVIGAQLLLRWFDPANPRCSLTPYDPSKPPPGAPPPPAQMEACDASYTTDLFYTKMVEWEAAGDTARYDAYAEGMRKKFDPRYS
jgi:hypothetical protein